MAYNDLDEDLLGYAPPQDLTGDLPGAYANDEPIGGTGNEIAEQPFQPGFYYTGPVAGEAAARAQYQTPVGPPDYRGNAYAHQAALDFDRRKAQAEAQREIEYTYKDARTAQQMKAVQAARDYLKQQEASRLIASGVSAPEAAMRSGLLTSGKDYLNYEKLNQPRMPEHIGDALVDFDPQTRTATELYRSRPQGLPQIDAMDLREAMAAKRAAQLALSDPIKGAYPEKLNQIITDADTVINRIRSQASQIPENASPPTAPTSQYKSATDVVADFKAQKIDRATAKKILTEQFGLK